MTHLLLVTIYLAFVSLGLPDSLLGAAWPSMYPSLGASVASAGLVSLTITVCTVISSLASDRLVRKFGTGVVTAVSTFLTAAALFGFSLSTRFWMLLLWALPYGLGAGSIDAALNNFVALHFHARHMSWLHCFWGLGAAIGPQIMAFCLVRNSWQEGYRTIATIQFTLTAILLLSLPLWKKKPRPRRLRRKKRRLCGRCFTVSTGARRSARFSFTVPLKCLPGFGAQAILCCKRK